MGGNRQESQRTGRSCLGFTMTKKAPKDPVDSPYSTNHTSGSLVTPASFILDLSSRESRKALA